MTRIALKYIALPMALACAASFGTAYAAGSCTPKKKLAGAALTSSVTKCCKTEAKARKLSGAAFNSNVAKCVKDNGA
jgi:hypothetical protein